MSAGITRASTMRFPIEDAWFERYKNTDDTDDHYVDIREMRAYGQGGTCAYFADLIAQRWYTQAECLAMSAYVSAMVVNGIHVGDGDHGNDIRGYLWDEPQDAEWLHYGWYWEAGAPNRQRRHHEFVDEIEHPVSFVRIYARGTKARDIAFLGVPSQ